MANRRKVIRKINRAAKRYGVDPRILYRQIEAESGFNPNAVSPAGARGIAQFIPSTAKAYGVNLNDNRIGDDIEGAARYMRDNLKRTGGDYREALSIYNSGKPDGYRRFDETRNYVAKILEGEEPKAKVRKPGREPATYETVPGVDRSADRQALQRSYLQNRHDPDALLTLGLSLKDAQDTPSSRIKVPGVTNPARGGSKSQGPGRVRVDAAADRPGARTQGYVIDFAREVSAIAGTPVRIGTGTRHSRLTVNGNVSDHWDGNAADIPASGRRLVRLGQAALIAAGMSPKKARKQRGGLYNVGGAQIIFATNEGGNHHDHLHVRPPRRR
jgi:hypothetical protein